MEFHFIVRHPFGNYNRGDRVTEPDEVARLAREGSDHVARVAVPVADTTPEEPPKAA